MSFDSREQANRLFQYRAFTAPAKASAGFSESVRVGKSPVFLVRRESAYLGWWASLKALCTRSKLPHANNSRYLYRDASLTGFRAPGLGLFNSFVLHCSLILGLIYLQLTIPSSAPKLSEAFQPPEVLFYPLPDQPSATALPHIAPQGTGGRPGSGIHIEQPPAPGKTASNGALTVISKPLRPDNAHQTIIQPASPPDVHIQDDLPLPNISMGSLAAPKAPTLNFDLHYKKPTETTTNVAAEPTPATAQDSGALTLATTLQPTNPQPKIPIPSSALAKPVHGDYANGGALGQGAPEVAIAGNGRSVLIIGVDPSGSTSGVPLPPGNREGDFSITNGAAGSGAPGGKAGGVAGGGSGGNDHSGDESVGIGPGHSGGGGGADGYPSAISITGTGVGTAAIGKLDDHLEASMIYAVPGSMVTNLRKNRMVVSAGPIGGGGLSVYRALPCGRIDTIFLPMAGASWTMQYCPKPGSAAAPKAEPQSNVIQMEAGVVPPNPDMQSRFDFKRVAVPPGKQQKMIVLRGTLQADGTIDALEVYQGVVAQMDEAARLAFSRWKFRPAMRGGKPIALDFLVGIPTEPVAGGESQ